MRLLAPMFLGALAAGALLPAGSGAARAQVRGDVTPLGRGAQSGAVCQAVRDYDDPVALVPGGRAWAIACRGWEAPIGRLYLLPGPAARVVWRKALDGRATCRAGVAGAVAGLSDVTRAACRLNGSTPPYLAYAGRRGRFGVAAEGYAAGADVLETGLRVVSGAMAPPAAMEPMSRASAEVAADFGGSPGGLASAERAAATDSHRLLARGYVQNNEWRFDQAETDFRTLAASARARNAPASEQAEALLNLALNVSDAGRFAEADALFAEADAEVARARNEVLSAEALNYRALHLRNQRRFQAAVTTARQALALRAAARTAGEAGAGGPAIVHSDGTLVIGAELSDALNTRAGGGDLLGGDAVPPGKRLLIQDVEALEVVGSCQAAAGEPTAGAQTLAQALDRLTAAEAQGVLSVRLRARLLADLGDTELDGGHAAAAVERYTQALAVLRTRHAGTSAEAGLLLDLGRAQIGAGRDQDALQTYGRAFSIFKAARGSLGGSAEAAGPYFDLLLRLSASDPARADAYADRFFTASETVVSDATASTVAQLAARVASGDTVTAGLVRAVDDTRRQLTAAESRIAVLQQQNAYAGAVKAAADAELTSLQGQLAAVEAELLNANPRYAQLVASDVALADLQKALRPGEVYLKTVLLDDRGYGLLVSRTAARPYPIALGAGQAEVAVTALRAPFEAEDVLPPFDVAASHRLFEQLFGPVHDQLLAARHLVYEPDGVLVSAPAALFVTDQASVDRIARQPAGAAGVGAEMPDYRGVAWLGARMDSSLVLSAASFMQSRAFRPSRARRIYLGFGDPSLSRSDPRAFASVLKRSGADLAGARVCGATRQALLDLPALPDTAGEVETIASTLGAGRDDVVLGGRFTDEALRTRTDLDDFRVLYFATHALLPMPDACLPQPALVTSVDGAGGDGLLDAADILNLKLDADLVVLSACDTGGAGSASASETGLQGGGGALGGLTRAVIYAGARGLIVSHWSVDSSATVRLMTGVFRSGAPTQAEGLQRAQLALQRDPRFSHPYYWAPFTVVGDGARPIPGEGAVRTSSAAGIKPAG